VDCTIANNTLFENDTTMSGSGEFQIQHHTSNNVFKNNIVFANSQGLLVNSFVPETLNVLDYNLFYSAAGAGNISWIWNNKAYTSFAAYQKATGNDKHGKLADPVFVSSSSPDLHVQSTSPAINAGIDLGLVPVGLWDRDGNPRTLGDLIDIGAYEH
jgi:hypothetical protein